MTKLIAVVGPTGSGKSDLGIALAQHIIDSGGKAEIINADSMQFYRGMNIGTAKLNVEQRQGIKHHCLDFLDVTQESTAAEFQKLARPLIEGLQAEGITPILVGGSMLYVAAVLNNFDFPARDEVLRAELEAELIEVGPNAMHRKLSALDATAASRIDPQNGRRIVRAIEIVTITGEPFAAALPEVPDSWQPVLEIGLQVERPALVQRLALRASRMFDAGLIEEVRELIPLGIRTGKTASQAIGYAQALGAIDGRLSLQQAVDETSSLTARYARRQMSWFRRDTRIHWHDALAADLTTDVFKEVRAYLDSAPKQ